MSSNVNRIFMTGAVTEYFMEASYASFVLQQTAFYKSNESEQTRTRTSDYKIIIYKPNILEMLKNIGNIDNLVVFINGYVASVERKGNSSYVAGMEFHDDKYSNVIVAQDIIFILQKPKNMSEEQFKNQLLNLNMCILLGNTGSDPEIKQLPDKELKIANISVATNMHFKQRSEATTWHKVSVIASPNNNLSGLMRVAENHIRRGDKILVIGTLQPRMRQDKNGETKCNLQVVLQSNNSNLSIISSKHPRERQDDRNYHVKHDQRIEKNNLKDYSLEYDEEDRIPF